VVRPALVVASLLTLPCGPVFAQSDASRAAERAAYSDWLATAPTSPLAAVAMHQLAGQVTLGPDTADVPLPDFGTAVVAESRGAVTLTMAGAAPRPLPRGRPVKVAPYTLQVLGKGAAGVLMIYGTPRGSPPEWYPVDSGLVMTVALEAAPAPSRRVLTLDGLTVEANPVGYVTVTHGGATARLQVMRMPIPGTEETELQVYFRDPTNDHGTYPAGRFVELTPEGGGQYRLDFNGARNPFCAYSSVYPCPVPWRGNSLEFPVTAGEKYLPTKQGG
jgi:uncharacterized protein (DUF1684 family)